MDFMLFFKNLSTFFSSFSFFFFWIKKQITSKNAQKLAKAKEEKVKMKRGLKIKKNQFVDTMGLPNYCLLWKFIINSILAKMYKYIKENQLHYRWELCTFWWPETKRTNRMQFLRVVINKPLKLLRKCK